MIVLGIETSCDECSASVVKDGKEILSNIIATQIELHRPYDGVVPELASRLHTEWISQVVNASIAQAGIKLADLDGVAVTSRPGLMGSLLVGVSFAKNFAETLKIPYIGIDHIRAHLYASQIENSQEYPYLGVLVSGGHTVICKVNSYDSIEVLGTTIDDAIGEAFDKVAKYYGFGFPGGVMVDRLATKGDALAFRFPGPAMLKGDHRYDMSYSGLKTAVINQLNNFSTGKEASPENIAASFQRQAVNILMKRVERALEDTGMTRLSAGGGVAANSQLRKKLKELEKKGIKVNFPSIKLCTDNGAMVAGLGYYYLKDGITSSPSLSPSSRVTAFRKK